MPFTVSECLPTKDLGNDSFDEIPTEDQKEDDAWKYAHVSVKKKSERKKLKGFSCSQCEQYYMNTKLPEKMKNDLIQQCAKHRATVKPAPSSPKGTKQIQ